jgi:putative membrane protein
MAYSKPEKDSTQTRADVQKGMLAGFIAGLAGTWTMSEFQGWWSRAVDGREPHSAGGRHDARDWQERNEGRNANELAAQAVATHAVGRDLTRAELKVAAPAVHYVFGSTLATMYGGLAETSPHVTAGVGIGYGVAVWAAADEVAMPILGLARRGQQYPVEAHLQSLAAHLVYGMTTEIVRRGVRIALR